MRHVVQARSSPFSPWDRRFGEVGVRAKNSYPTPEEMFFKIGATILIAAIVGLAVDHLLKGFGA
jgi:hypothetical protein